MKAVAILWVFAMSTHVALGADDRFFVDAQWREQYLSVRNPFFGLRGPPHDDFALHRLLLGGGARLWDGGTIYGQLGYHDHAGHDGAPGPFDEDTGDVQQGWLEFRPIADAAATVGARIGRQELPFGRVRLLSARDGPNSRLSYDGVSAFLSSEEVRITFFAARPVVIRPEAFDDRSNEDQFLGGAYFRHSNRQHPFVTELYYLVSRRDGARFVEGAGSESRTTVGSHITGAAGGWDYDMEAAYQFGDFDTRAIRAWLAGGEAGYRFPLAIVESMRPGLRLEVQSGDSRTGDNRLETFHPLAGSLHHLGEGTQTSGQNLLDLNPGLALAFSRTLSLKLDVNFLWRVSANDAVYAPSLTPLAVAPASRKRHVANLTDLEVLWDALPWLRLAAHASHYEIGPYLEDAGARNVEFWRLTALARH